VQKQIFALPLDIILRSMVSCIYYHYLSATDA